MKLFWKMFFTTMIISAASLALGGYILINSNVHPLLDNEAHMAYDYGDIVYYSLSNEISTAQINFHEYLSAPQASPLTKLSQVASSISISRKNQTIPFAIVTTDGKLIFSSLSETLDKKLLDSLNPDHKGWSVKQTENGTYIQALRPASYQGTDFYIETLRDVSYIFEGQEQQYETLLKIMLSMFCIVGVIVFAISKLLTRRMVELTEMTANIADGDFSSRAAAKGNDEITVLSESFNRMADELEEKMLALQEEARKKELFMGAFSHELKTPLTSIIGYSDMLRRKEMSREQLHNCAEYIFSEGKRLENISLRLMDIIVLNNQDIHPVSLNIPSFIDEISQSLIPQYEKLHIDLIPDVEEATVRAEPDLMKTVLINLIDNGRKAIESSGCITITGRRQTNDYIISISDIGKGMEAQELDRIKEAFYMVDKSRSRQQGGAGLGLSICDKIIKLHGFEMSFDSIPGIGTMVNIIMKGAVQSEAE